MFRETFAKDGQPSNLIGDSKPVCVVPQVGRRLAPTFSLWRRNIARDDTEMPARKEFFCLQAGWKTDSEAVIAPAVIKANCDFKNPAARAQPEGSDDRQQHGLG